MIALNAYTEELDDVNLAVSQILSQLDIERNMKTSAIGIVQCYSEFLDNGIVAAIADALPFDIMGTTTIYNGTRGGYGGLGLSIQVLTGDEVSFSAHYSDPLADSPEASVKRSYETAAARRDGRPALIFTFSSFLETVAGDQVVSWLDEASGGVPNFGCLAIDHTPDFSNAKSFFNKECSNNRIGVILVYGDLHPRFLMASIAEENIMPQTVTVTKSAGNVLMEVNDIPFAQYLQQLGLAADNTLTAKETLPLIIDFLDGAQPVARSLIALTPEGCAVLGGTVPVGAQLRIGTSEYLDVTETAQMMFESALAPDAQQCLIVFSCLGRFFALGVRIDDEIVTGNNLMQGRVPFMLGYTGGEICPVPAVDGVSTINKFHNFTIVTCVL